MVALFISFLVFGIVLHAPLVISEENDSSNSGTSVKANTEVGVTADSDDKEEDDSDEGNETEDDDNETEEDDKEDDEDKEIKGHTRVREVFIERNIRFCNWNA